MLLGAQGKFLKVDPLESADGQTLGQRSLDTRWTPDHSSILSNFPPTTRMDRLFNKKRKKSPEPPQSSFSGKPTNVAAGSSGFQTVEVIGPEGGRNPGCLLHRKAN